MSNSFSFNQTFKFSFAHIISFVAMLLIGYGVFMGLCYWWGGEFYKALGAALGAMAVILGGIYFMQMLKASERDFEKNLRRERAVVVLFVGLCLACFLPYNHFWLVNSQGDVLEGKFTSAMQGGKAMFTHYHSYAQERQEAYRQHLDTAVLDPDSEAYQVARSLGGNKVVMPLLHSAAELRLLPSNYGHLRGGAEKWIDESQAGFSAFNVHLLGNLSEIKEAFMGWHAALSSYADYRLLGESESMQVFDRDSKQLETPITQLESIRQLCTEASGISFIGILTGLVLFGLLSLPYHLQGRHTKARTHYAFWRAIPSGRSDDSTFFGGGSRTKREAGENMSRESGSIDMDEKTSTEGSSRRRRGGSFKM